MWREMELSSDNLTGSERNGSFVPWDQRAPAATQQASEDTRCEPSLGHFDSPPVDQFSSVSQAVLRERLDSGQCDGAPGCNQLTPRPVRGRSGATRPGPGRCRNSGTSCSFEFFNVGTTSCSSSAQVSGLRESLLRLQTGEEKQGALLVIFYSRALKN